MIEEPREHDSLAANPATKPGRERLLWTGAIAGVALIVFGLMVVSSFLPTRPDLQRLTVDQVLTGTAPVDRFGSHEVRVAGWYAALSGARCRGDSGGADTSVGWLQAQCPLRVLLAERPSNDVTQAQLLARGLRLSAPTGDPFPPPTAIGSGTAGMEELVFVGHFGDAASSRCLPERAEECRNTFVVTDYSGLIR